MIRTVTAALLASTLALQGCGDSSAPASSTLPTTTQTPSEKPPVITSYSASDLDFSFAENSTPYRKQVLASINQLMRSDPRCVGGSMIDGTLVSVSEKRSSNPLLQIACTKKEGTHRAVEFYAKDAEIHPLPDKNAEVSREMAASSCSGLLSAKIAMPVTMRATDVIITKTDNGLTDVRGKITSSARSFNALCVFQGSDLLRGSATPIG